MTKHANAKAHQAHAQWTPERLIAWGERIGVACAGVVTKMLERQRHPEHARAALGLAPKAATPQGQTIKRRRRR